MTIRFARAAVAFAWQGCAVEAPVSSNMPPSCCAATELERFPWDSDGQGEHSLDAQRQTLVHYADAGGIARGAFSDGRLVGIGVVVPHMRPAIAQLAFLHVSQDFRAAGVGSRLAAALELVARRAGDREIVVSATPSENTVRFYWGRGYRPMARPLPELLELEPEDVHMGKVI